MTRIPCIADGFVRLFGRQAVASWLDEGTGLFEVVMNEDGGTMMHDDEDEAALAVAVTVVETVSVMTTPDPLSCESSVVHCFHGQEARRLTCR